MSETPSETTHSDEEYPYVDQTAPDNEGITAQVAARIEETTSADSNPAFYPASAKSEAMLNEAEQGGAEFPGSDPAAAASGVDSDGEDLDEDASAALTQGAPVNASSQSTEAPADTEADEVPADEAGEATDEPSDELDEVLAKSVPEVLDYALEHPEQAQALLERELEEDSPRVTLLPDLEVVAATAAESSEAAPGEQS